MLLEFNANANLTDINEQTRLHIASTSGNVEVVTLLLDNAASVDSIACEKSTPLMETCAAGLIGVVKVLLDNGASVGSVDNSGWTPLYIAADCGHLEIAKLLLDNAASVYATIGTGYTPLIIAAGGGRLEMVQVLLGNGSSVNVSTKNGWSPLVTAAGDLEVAKVLLDNGASVHSTTDEMTDSAGVSRIQWTSRSVLLDNGASVDLATQNELIPLMEVTWRGHFEVVAMLLKNNYNMDEVSANGWFSLMMASKNGHVKVVQVLLENAANVDVVESNGWSSLMMAAAIGHFEVVEMLLDSHASVDLTIGNDATPLFAAAQNDHLGIVEILLRNNADWDVNDADGITPFHAAVLRGRGKVVDFFLSKGVSPDQIDKIGSTPLISACRNGHSQVTQSLLKKGASHGAVNTDGESALVAAAASGCFEAVDTLIQAGASPHVRAINGDTILIHAAKWGDIATVNQLFEAGQLNTQITTESRVSLLGGTLQTLRELSKNVHEFQTLWSSVSGRLTQTCEQIQAEHDSVRAALHHYIMIIFRLVRLKAMWECSSMYTRLIFNRSISVLQRAKSQVMWLQQELFRRHIDEILELLSVSSEDSVHKWTRCGATRDTEIGNLKGVINRSQSPKAAAAGTVKILRFGHFDTEQKFESIGRSEIGANKSGVVPQLPKWYIPTHELKYNRDAPIAVGAFDECNILIGADEDAKIADSGLSCILNSTEVKVDSKLVGATQRKSPEYLRGDRLTAASDLYAFGMCILEAEGNLPSISLECLAGAERGLVEMVCAPNPSERIRISSVVEKLDEFAKLEATATKAAPSASLNDVAP
ncbi:Tkl protein kinase, partial [Globisporangium splendens]